ncbi:hypothetical protein A0H81_14353 [Grifola frondosa]|uniref:Uncharacterized protein n=1 Tax=Grifola frondosa TaxID=5627 RepID=A0A1C7LP32_GRIFR|nr:hypothetical protein A0H81_14353 [Grifola frondosa]
MAEVREIPVENTAFLYKNVYIVPSQYAITFILARIAQHCDYEERAQAILSYVSLAEHTYLLTEFTAHVGSIEEKMVNLGVGAGFVDKGYLRSGFNNNNVQLAIYHTSPAIVLPTHEAMEYILSLPEDDMWLIDDAC